MQSCVQLALFLCSKMGDYDPQNSLSPEVSSQTCPLLQEDAELIEELKNAYRCESKYIYVGENILLFVFPL